MSQRRALLHCECKVDAGPAAVEADRLSFRGVKQCRIIGPISLIGMGIFRTRSIWNAPTTNKQRNALRNSYPIAMPSFGRRIGLLRYTPRERDHYHRLIISSVSHDSEWTLSS